jgi:molybdopterin-guanine dinucleotide biosynthesis protein A
VTVTTAAIVLAGGRSTRMGTPKAELEWHGSTLLRRAACIAQRAVDGPVVVVRAPGQKLAQLPPGIEIAQDAHSNRGPLEGLAAGLRAIADRADAVYLTGVDAPFLHPAFVRRVLALLGPDDDVALPHAHGFAQPLAAAYRAATVGAPLRALLQAGEQLGTRALMQRCRVRQLGEAALLADPAVAAFDPALDSVLNINDQDELDAARARPAPRVTIDLDDGEPPLAIRAATLGEAAAVAGIGLAGNILATIGGERADDPQQPLVTGDVVVLSAARA